MRNAAAFLYEILESVVAGAFIGLFARFALSMLRAVLERAST